MHQETFEPALPMDLPASDEPPATLEHMVIGYFSDLYSDHSNSSSDEGCAEDDSDTLPHRQELIPPLKHYRLVVSYCAQRAAGKGTRIKELKAAFEDIEKLLCSKKTQFIGDTQGLQAKCAQTIQSHLLLVVRKSHNFIDASQHAAEIHGFAMNWGSHQLHGWTNTWVASHDLPKSQHDCHVKVYSLLNDPAIAAECRAYLHSHKWSMNPEKLANFTASKLVGNAVRKYLQHLVDTEMPAGLKRYLELDLFPHIHMKAVHGVSLSTAHCWLHAEGFRYISHNKGLYFNGHDHPDVIDYHQNVFLPFMKAHEGRLVCYTVGDVEQELESHPENYIECWLVLVPHDEMITQANNDNARSWVLKDKFRLKKKGVGCGLHQSGVICSTCGHLDDAGKTMEYGKQYDGHWTGKHFVNQVAIMCCCCR